ncbi:PAS-domain containing protein [Magnetospirillum sp. UT-4]|uniref:PAS-domain containing protein n=1 Tax=Magnetospirillum sp. UT-4 TaxID=2681467 RepID=UPI00137D8C92|nr:PAS-domain containing protein [Magnetospirillum sp. UT-4]CAA7614232.1 putative Sensory transduction histidine kinase [Magnetospirillum sp. UT-4]
MELALQAALLGAVMGSALLALSTLYGWSLPGAPSSYGWWAGAFVLQAVGMAVLLLPMADRALVAHISDGLHGLSAGFGLCGALAHGGRRVRPVLMVAGLAMAAAWLGVAEHLRAGLGLADMPLCGIGGVPLLLAAWFFLTGAAGASRSDAKRIAATTFAAAGLHQLATPLLHASALLATWSFVLSQFLSMALALALLMVVLRRQQARADSEGQRADLLQSRLIDAFSGVEDGLAVFDAADRLVTCNDRYLDMLAPAAGAIKPGRSFADILAAEAERGVVVGVAGTEQRWVAEMLDSQARAEGREVELWDGRWVAISVYRTADGGRLRILRDITNRKHADIALQESVSWLRGIMDTVVDGIVTIDETGTVLSFNRAAERIFGFASEEVAGRNVSMLMPEPYRSEHDSYLRRYVETREARIIDVGRQVKGVRKDGAVFPLELAITEMRQGDMVTFIGLVRDITDRKRVEDALVESEQRFRDLAESASDWFWELDGELCFTFVSGRVRQVLGVGPNHFIGRAFAGLADVGAEAEDWAAQVKAMQARRPFRGFVFRQALPSGAVKYIEMAGRPAFDSDGRFRGYRGTATDITPVKRHEQEVGAQSALRQAIIDNMGQGVAVFDGSEILVALNRQARVLLDFADGELEQGVARLEDMLMHMAKNGEFGRGDAAQQAGRRLRRLRRQPSQTFEHLRPSGIALEVRSTAMPKGGLILTFSDITERKRSEDALREAKEAAERGNRAKATFLANISHELRTPLNAIIGFSELMKHEIYGPMEPVAYGGYVDDIHESGMHLLELINDILDMSKAEAGMTELDVTEVEVGPVLQGAVRMMARRAQSHGILLSAMVPPDLPFLRADERRLRQIVLNLVSNAVKFTEEGGSVTVSAAVGADGLTITVADTGIGMTEEEMKRVMEPFVQADTRLSRKYEGTGLGLPLTNALVSAHGGRLTLRSSPGAGTVATVAFPPERVVRHGDTAMLAALDGVGETG